MSKKVKVRLRETTTKERFLKQLSNPLQVPTEPATDVTETEKEGRKSSFFFRIGADKQEVKRREALSKPKEVEPTNAEILERAATYKKELEDALRTDIDVVREFLLKEISPKVLAAQTGAYQFMEVLAETTGSEVTSQLAKNIDRMVNEGINIKVANFLGTFLSLDQDAIDAMKSTTKVPVPKTNVVVMPNLADVKPEGPLRS